MSFKKIYNAYTREIVRRVKLVEKNPKHISRLDTIRDYSLFVNKDNTLALTVGEYSKMNNHDNEILLTSSRQMTLTDYVTDGYLVESSVPDVLANFKSLSQLQTTIRDEILNNIHKCHSYCFNASCGDGKTMATIYLMSQLKIKTIIISSRNAVNDQWKHELNRLFPNLKVVTRINEKDNETNGDVLICTPQYLSPKIQQYVKTPKDVESFFKSLQYGLIVYDELHSLLSEQFSLVLSLPFILKSKNIVKQTPYTIGLTASLPNTTSDDYKLIRCVFGEPLRFVSTITQIPVRFIDYRDTIPSQKRGFCDGNYRQPNDETVCKHYSDIMIARKLLPSIAYKLIAITSTIDSSIRCALQTCIDFKQDVLVMRAVNETSMMFRYNVIKEKLGETTTSNVGSLFDMLLEFTEENIRKEHKNMFESVRVVDLQKALPQVAIIVGTYHRLKEGFNCKNIVYGICTKFIWSETSRVQILGRIRRSSDDEALNKHDRYFFVCSGRIPSNLFHHRPHEKIEVKYDLDFESQLFKNENYIRCRLKK